MYTPDSTHHRHTRRTNVPNPNRRTGTGPLTAAGSPYYFELGGIGDVVQSVQLRWFDATSNATVVLQTCNLPDNEVDWNSTNAYDWATEPTVIVGPTAVAAGTSMTHLGNLAPKRKRLVVTVLANTELDIVSAGVH